MARIIRRPEPKPNSVVACTKRVMMPGTTTCLWLVSTGAEVHLMADTESHVAAYPNSSGWFVVTITENREIELDMCIPADLEFALDGEGRIVIAETAD